MRDATTRWPILGLPCEIIGRTGTYKVSITVCYILGRRKRSRGFPPHTSTIGAGLKSEKLL